MHSFCLFVAAFTTLISQSLFVWRLRLFGIYQSIHTVDNKQKECWQLYDQRLNTLFHSMVNAQPYSVIHSILQAYNPQHQDKADYRTILHYGLMAKKRTRRMRRSSMGCKPLFPATPVRFGCRGREVGSMDARSVQLSTWHPRSREAGTWKRFLNFNNYFYECITKIFQFQQLIPSSSFPASFHYTLKAAQQKHKA